MNFYLFISCPKGLEDLLANEVKHLGLNISKVNPQGVYGEGNLAVAYNICIWSRIANRVQIILFNGNAYNKEMIYQLCNQFPWQTIFASDKTFAIEFHGSSVQIKNSMFGAQLVKDAIVDYFKKLSNTRPNVARENPEILIHAHLKDSELTVSFDLTGYSMHKRGYRLNQDKAPIKENVAAAMLLRANFLNLSQKGCTLYDPFCGSGTIVIEAAMLAANIAPGLLRNDQSLNHFAKHQNDLWLKLRNLALKQVKPLNVKFYGTDISHKSIADAKQNAMRAGVSKLVEFNQLPLDKITSAPIAKQPGLLISNPPYGERLGESVTNVIPIYQNLGKIMNTYFQKWQAAIITNNQILAKAIGLRSHKQYTIFNGAIECKLYCFNITHDNHLKSDSPTKLSDNAQMFVNRLQKNYAHLSKWAKRNHITCYRIYDADLPQYAYAIDLYNDYAVLQEYAPPSEIPKHKAEQHSLDVLLATQMVLKINKERLVIKTRKPQKGLNQYEKLNTTKHNMMVREGRAKLLVNLYDYLDTGLFLDNRLLRLKFENLPKDTRFLNCFCYTASASVHAAIAGAITTNIDLSKTYLNWAFKNFQLNDLDPTKHRFIHTDCTKWLASALEKFDVILLDPPSFSNSKRMTNTLDILRDHEQLIKDAMRLLKSNGTLYFLTNLKNFKLSPKIYENFKVLDFTTETIDEDFKRNKKIHYCFKIQN